MSAAIDRAVRRLEIEQRREGLANELLELQKKVLEKEAQLRLAFTMLNDLNAEDRKALGEYRSIREP